MNVVTDPVFTVETSAGRETCSLPRIFRLLQRDDVEGFSALQAHQKQAWHCLLAQLGAIATETIAIPTTEEGWRDALLATAPFEAWELHPEDLETPAFLQPPVPEGSVEDWKPIHPSSYDVPVLSKSHALKMRRLNRPSPEHWAYLLVNVQTTGFYSPGGRRTSRMNGSYGSRPFFGLTPSLRLGPWIMHDIATLRAHVGDIEDHYTFTREVSPLLWTLPWEGTESLEVDTLHPLYIDCPRRIRWHDGQWLKTSTPTERVTGDVNGQTGDPWAPVNTEDNKVLNPGRAAFEYRQLADILFGERYRRPISFQNTTAGYVVCRAVTGDQGARVHHLQRVIPFSNRRRGWDEIETEAKTRVQEAETAATILFHALSEMLCDDADEGAAADGKAHKDKVRPLIKRQTEAFHSRIDQHFFDQLFQTPDLPDDTRRAFWQTLLDRAVRKQHAAARTLCPRKKKWKRLAVAESIVHSGTERSFTHADASV